MRATPGFMSSWGLRLDFAHRRSGLWMIRSLNKKPTDPGP